MAQVSQALQALREQQQRLQSEAEQSVKTVFASFEQHLSASLSGAERSLKADIAGMRKRLLWALQLPLLILVLVAITICAGTWSWAQWNLRQAGQARQELAATRAEIERITAEFWASPAGRNLQRQPPRRK